MADFFEYGATEIAHLKARDPILGAAIDRIGFLERGISPNLFKALLQTIISQQISAKAAQTVCLRFESRFPELNPAAIAEADLADIQSCGMSMRKASYLQAAAKAIAEGTIDLAGLPQLSDEEIRTQLTELKGIGKWTADMLLTFSLQRPNIISFDDLAIQRGMRLLYRHRKITPNIFAKHQRRYSPYASTAALYLWEIAGGQNS